ncbi:MAG TPA: PLP-dependent aminotransferase family protein [Candidatus Elarobacter sp.]|nr:PLP-dependent aminotransferase family protein [Candidatus Elarobacter sp.]
MRDPTRPDRFVALSSLDVDIGRRGTIRVQLLDQFRAAIRDRRLPAGSRLPSTRAVAERLHISRSTVTDVFDQLLAEGYLVARHGAGTYVSPAVRGGPVEARSASAPPSTSWERVSRRGKLFADITTRSRYTDKEPRAFQPGVPAVDLFPFGVWSRIAASLLRRPPRELVSYGDPAGFRALREAIAAQLRDRKHGACDADQVIVTSGTQQSLDIINRLMLDPDEAVWVEDPGSLAARATFVGAGVRLVPVPVDEDGMVVAHGVAAAPRARLAFVTPAVQSPTTVTMSAARRAALLAWADAADAWIVEDDYEDVFRYDGEDPAPLHSIAANERVILIGSFSLSTFPALRIGYIVAPRALVDAFVAAKAAIDRQGATLEQAVLAQFVLGGHHLRHLRRMSGEYAERRAALARCFAQYLPELPFAPPRAGLHALLPLGGRDDVALARAAARRGISVTPLSPLYLDRERRRNGLLIGFGVASPGEIRLGARKLRDAFVDVRGRTLAAR